MTRDAAGQEYDLARDPRFPTAIEVRVPGRTTRHLFDWHAILPEYSTIDAMLTAVATGVLTFEGQLVEEAILEGHDRIETQINGQPTIVRTVPSWWTETRSRWKVERARRKRRRAKERELRAGEGSGRGTDGFG